MKWLTFRAVLIVWYWMWTRLSSSYKCVLTENVIVAKNGQQQQKIKKGTSFVKLMPQYHTETTWNVDQLPHNFDAMSIFIDFNLRFFDCNQKLNNTPGYQIPGH